MNDALALSVFAKQVSAVCEEMGAVLKRTAFSPNIRDRMDYSCAVFDAGGRLVEQAAAIPVHLGSMAYAMADVVAIDDWSPQQQLIFNDPFRGGTHLPDVTVVAALFIDGRRVGFVANRAHHADIGGDSPGSMPLSTRVEQEGVIIAPTLIADMAELADRLPELVTRTTSMGDFAAQFSANLVGIKRLAERISAWGMEGWRARVDGLSDYAERLARASIKAIPDGVYCFEDRMDDDGQGNEQVPITLGLTIDGDHAVFDFSHSENQVAGNINCPLAVTAAAVHYVLRCLMPPHAPQSAGAMLPVKLICPAGSMLNARYPAAVAAGNVETSMRVVDVVCGALAQALPQSIPAAAQGTMNNIALGRRGDGGWDFYETLAGGCGAHCASRGRSATHSHMTNTLNTPIETMEYRYPLRILRYQLRAGSGGKGRLVGGDGLIREYQLLKAAQLTLLSERRSQRPWGLDGGGPGQAGANYLNGEALAAKCSVSLSAGDIVRIETPGGGAWGSVNDEA